MAGRDPFIKPIDFMRFLLYFLHFARLISLYIPRDTLPDSSSISHTPWRANNPSQNFSPVSNRLVLFQHFDIRVYLF